MTCFVKYPSLMLHKRFPNLIEITNLSLIVNQPYWKKYRRTQCAQLALSAVRFIIEGIIVDCDFNDRQRSGVEIFSRINSNTAARLDDNFNWLKFIRSSIRTACGWGGMDVFQTVCQVFLRIFAFYFYHLVDDRMKMIKT